MGDDIFPSTLTPSNPEAWAYLLPCLQSLDRVEIFNECIKIGRINLCDVVLDSSVGINTATVSKEHCLIKRDSSQAYVVDLSRNGTFINGTIVGKDRTAPIKDGDKIALGKEHWNIFIFKTLLEDQLPDTLTSVNQLTLTPREVLPVWGRLIACSVHLKSFDICSHTFKVGRLSHCDAAIEQMDIKTTLKLSFSREQFVIVKDADTNLAFIEDLSSRGTYLNGQLIGMNRKNILQNDDIIGISNIKQVYVYKAMNYSKGSYLPEELRMKYEPCKLLGKGGCGEVRLAFEKRSCKMFAIKNILKARESQSQIHKLNNPSMIRTEINILEDLSHPFVIRMEHAVETDQEVFIVLEYMQGGDLSNRILSNVPLTETQAKFMFYQMVLAVQFLHFNGITHRDLKPENVLLSSDEPEPLIKITDFGLSKITEDTDTMKTVCGTRCYMAPEVLLCRPYDKKVDVWSLGVILFYMLSKKLPFRASDKQELAKLVVRGAYDMEGAQWNGVSAVGKDLVKKMLVRNPKDRITLSEILKHPWLANDIPVQFRVHSLMKEDTYSQNVATTCSPEMPVKRVRLNSAESTE